MATDDDIILRGLRIVILSFLRAHVVNLAHEGHQGLVKTKALLHEKVWFPKIYELTEHLVKSCIPCQSAVQHHPREPLQMSKLPMHHGRKSVLISAKWEAAICLS